MDHLEYEIWNNINTSYEVHYVFLRENSKLKLTCKPLNEDNYSVLLWLKNGYKIENDTNRVLIETKYSPLESTLIVNEANDTDVGDYQCLLDMVQHNQTIVKYSLRAKPRVMFNFTQLKFSETVLINNDWSLLCKFMSPNYAVDAQMKFVRCQSSWYNNEPIPCTEDNLAELQLDTMEWINLNSNRIKLSMSTDHNNCTVALFQIQNVTFSDRATFVCHGKNFMANVNVSVSLRVTDRCSFLWPSMLFVTFALYLFTLIGVFECRRIQATSLLKLEWDKNI